MPAPRWVAEFNKTALNKGTRLIAPWAPGWAVVVHRGRKSGRVFRGRRYRLTNPRIYRDDAATDMPVPIRFMLRRVIKAPEFLRLDIADELS